MVDKILNKADLVRNSPLRKLEESIHGNFTHGSIGIIASRRGIGKMACLVHMATDKLIAGKHVIHVSYSKRTNHIIDWYEDIFREISVDKNINDVRDIHDQVSHNRVIMNFSQQGYSVLQVISSVRAMMDSGQMYTDLIMVDGFDFTKASEEDLVLFRNFGKENKVAFWFTDDYHRKDIDGAVLNEDGIPTNLVPFLDKIEVIVTLKAEKDYLHLYLVKDYDRINRENLPLKLDPRTLLIVRS